MNRIRFALVGILFAFAIVVGSGCDTDNALIAPSIKTVAEYGTYFGMKVGKVKAEKAKLAEEGVRSVLVFLKTDSLGDIVKIDLLLANLDNDIVAIIKPVFTSLDGKYLDIKNKIPEDKLPIVIAVFEGAFTGIENYRKTLGDSDSHVAAISVYEAKLNVEYKKAKEVLK